ncbi:MAG: glycosyltransferase [Xanthomonadales bacterium]|nr:glycosyltransferase [Xanthomonadales bacterium]
MRGAALIVLAWNQWPLTRRCLDSLLASELDQAEVIVVDNGSEDDTAAGLAAYAGRVRVVPLPENLGFVRGMNAGIAAARPDDDVVLLNNDLVFTQADWLGRLRDAAYAAPDHGVVGCRLLGPEAEGRLYHAGGFIEADELWGQQTETGLVERDVAQFDATRRVQGIAFALAYLRRDCLERIGGLDEIFHSYFEDTDYCLRAADAGIASVLAGAVTLRHDQHGSTREDGGFRERLRAASKARFAARWQARLRGQYRGEVLWQGVTRAPHAHAQLARQFVRRLDAHGARMAFEPVAAELPDAQDFRLELAARRRWSPPAAVALVAAPGEHFGAARGRARIGFGFGDWQRVPESWAEAANRLDLLLVPDAFQREAFLGAGVRAPIEVLPPGVDRDYCHTRVPRIPHPRGAFVFLAVIDDPVRDAPECLLQAFAEAFSGAPDVELLLYLRPGAVAPAAFEALVRTAAATPTIRIVHDWAFPWHQRAWLLASIDAYVPVRRGGGWDPLAAEAVACGQMLLATDFGSQAELVRGHGLPVAVAGLSEDPRRPGLRWAEPDQASLVAQLREAVARQSDFRAGAEQRAGEFAAAHDIEASADRLFARIAELGAFAPAPPRPLPHAPAHLERPASGQVVVLGMHRSGTSGVAGLLARIGAWPGPEEELLVGPDNPKGHYESAPLHGACLRRLAAAGGDWRNPPASAPPAAVDAFRRDVATLLERFEPHRPWFIKEPRLCLLARELLPLLTRPVFVLVVREPGAVARSLARRDGFAESEALALWERYNREAFAASRGWPRVLVDYDRLVADPLAETRRLLGGLRALGVAGLAEPSPDVLREWIEPGADRSPPPEPVLTAAQAALWKSIRDGSILGDVAPDALTPSPVS